MHTSRPSGPTLLVVLMTLWFLGNLLAILLMNSIAWQLGVADLKSYYQQILDGQTPNDLDPLRVFLTIGMLCNFGIPAWIFAHFLGRDQWRTLLLWNPPGQSAWQWLRGATLITLSLGMVMQAYWLNSLIPLPEALVQSETQANQLSFALTQVTAPTQLAVTIAILGLLPAFCEELFFRGGLQTSLTYLLRSPHAGIIATALLFSAMHGQFAGFLPRAIVGLLLGYTAYWTGSLWVTILMHALFNSIQVLQTYIARPTLSEALTPQPTPIGWFVLSTIAALFFLQQIHRYRVLSPYSDEPRIPPLS